MHVVPIAPDIDPALLLTDGAIRAVFNPATLEAGRIYELRGRVRNVRITHQGAMIQAETFGTAPDPYIQRIAVGRRRGGGIVITSMCTCPVGRDCKHVAAVLVAAHREELAVEKATPTAASSPVCTDPARDSSLPHDIAGWLSGLDADDSQETEEYPDSIRQRLHYVLSVTEPARGAPALLVRPFSVRLLMSGKPSHPKQYAPQNAAVSTPRYFRPSDKLILARLRRGLFSGQAAVEEDPVDTLRRILTTGRAFWQQADGGGSTFVHYRNWMRMMLLLRQKLDAVAE